MRNLLTVSVLIPFALVCATASAQSHVFKVGGTGGLATVQAAVDAAADGDLILVRSGTHAAFNVFDKALTILPAQGASVTISGETRIEGSSTGKLTVLGNVSCKSATSVHTAALVLRDNLGTVLLRDANIQALTTPAIGGYGSEALRLDNSKKVIIDRCSILGADAVWYADGGAGLIAYNFNLASFRSTYRGGQGSSFSPCQGCCAQSGGGGGHGVVAMNGFAFAAGGASNGGSGGSGTAEYWDWLTGIYFPPGTGGTGGAGIVLGPSAHVEELAITVAGGPGGPGGDEPECAYEGATGPAHQLGGGSFHTLSGSRREITLPSLEYEGSQVPISAAGAPGESVFLMSSRRAVFSFDASLSGCTFIPQPTLDPATSIGVIPPSGVLQSHFSARTLPPADETGTFVIQALFVPPSGAARLSNATAIALVDASIPLN